MPVGHRQLHAGGPGERRWRQRERECSWMSLAACAACLLFSMWPEIDLHVSRQFLGVDGSFVGHRQGWALASYWAVPWLSRAVAAAALVLALAAATRPPSWLGVRAWRRLRAVGLVMAVATGVVVNAGFKEHWGRARPSSTVGLGGSAPFEPALRPSQACQRNCSFSSGHAASGFTVMSVGLFGAPATRRRWLAIGGATGLGVGLGRIAQGAHFLSDIVFAGLMVWACCIAIRLTWLAWVAGHGRYRRRGGEVSPAR